MDALQSGDPGSVGGNAGIGPVKGGTVMSLSCWTTGSNDHGNVPPYTTDTNVWVHVTNSPGPGYMSILWFPNPYSVTSGLPEC
jgi:hypothetical protein